MATQVDLGFLEKCSKSYLLTNKFFPSKVGGRPAWLDLEKIPESKTLKCNECNRELVFLCQVYAPVEELDHCFHRTIYVFICTNASCWQPNSSKNIKVFRCQLPLENKFYEAEPANEEIEQEEVPSPVKLCSVCGCKGTAACSKCHSANYCGVNHQKIDWTLGGHKTLCGQSNEKPKIGNPKHQFLFEEFELLIDPEELDNLKSDETEDEAEARRLKEYEEFQQSQKAKENELKDVPDEEFHKYVNATDEDVTFSKFKKRIECDPQQVLRYDRNGEPLWITEKNKLNSEDVSNCERCNGRRVFEFQIMPQLLNSLHQPDIDWGILAIYTCESSCETNGEYAHEFVHKQDIVE